MKTNRIAALMILMLCCVINLSDANAEEVVNIQYIGEHGTHTEYYLPADAPEVFFNADDMEIIIVADGFASYYDVDIISQATFFTDISTQVGGYGDNVDVSSLTIGYYQIVITSSNNNVYEGYFTVE